jgi:cellulose synthase/poly-beta-1,6-N-acetylglucosamine synthase-like glycosyltransferase
VTAADGAHEPALSLVVSTVGRAGTFTRLLNSLETVPTAGRLEVVVVDQSPDQSCAAVARSRPWAVPIITTTSPRGASIGRNAGLALASAPVVAFPDDDAYFPARTLAAVLARFAAEPELAGLCGQQQTADGRPSMLRWQAQAGPVTARNFLHTSIMSTMFFRRRWLDQIGGFDDAMGVGAPGWYHAGEESDLVLRVVEAGGRVLYDPSLIVWQDEPRDVPDEAFVRKMLEYGCGQGHLWRKRSLSRSLLAWYLGRKVVAAAVRTARGQRTLARADIAWARGNVAGFLDRCPAELVPAAGVGA